MILNFKLLNTILLISINLKLKTTNKINFETITQRIKNLTNNL